MNSFFEDKKKKYLISFALPFVVLISMTILPILTNFFGSEISIKTAPYDPRDVFRGDYVTLNYEINEIKLDQIDKEILDLTEGNDYYDVLKRKKIYVSLKEIDGLYQVDRASFERPKTGIYLKAKFSHMVSDWQLERSKGDIIAMRVDYTLDKFFVPENTGKDLEEQSRKGELYAKVKVFRGYSLLKEISDKK